MEFTKEQTNIAKGVAICLMFAHHLYAFNDRLIHGNTYIPLIPFINSEAKIGSFGNICVSIFLFLSGYGMFFGYLTSKRTLLHYSLSKLRSFYLTYWLYFLIFIPIGLLYFQNKTLWHSPQIRYSLEPKIFLENLVGWSSTYNEEWWFIRVFVVSIIVLFPLYFLLVNKDVILCAFVSLLLFYLSYRVDPYSHLGFIYWQTSFALGIICAKQSFFSSNLIKAFNQSGWIWNFAWLLLCFVLRLKVQTTRYDFLIVPFVIYFSCRSVEILNLSKVFAYLGKYSFSLWLIHSFFCYYYFQDIIYFPKWSPLIFILLTSISLLSVLAIDFLSSYLLKITFTKKAA